MKFKFNFRLDKRRKLDNGCFPIKVNLHSYSEGRNFDFSIPDHHTSNGDVIKLTANNDNDFEKIWSKKDKFNNFGEIIGEQYVTGRRSDVRTVLKIKEDILEQIIERKEVITVSDVKKAFKDYKPKKVTSLDLISCFDEYIPPIEKQERIGYAKGLRVTRNNFIRYLNSNLKETKIKEIDEAIKLGKVKSMSLYDITPEWLSEYETKRKKETGQSGINKDATNIRSVYNHFAKGNEVLKLKYPFGKKSDDKYQIKTTGGKNVGLELEDVRKIMEFSSENYWHQMARDYWVFSYLGGGLNLKDILYLTKDNHKKGFYIREKTKNTTSEIKKIKLSLVDEMPEIIERHKGTGKYLFDVLNDEDSPEDAYRKYKSRWSVIRDHLTIFIELLDLPKNFSWQWARHSVAYQLSKGNVSGFKIMDKLGHSDIKSTQNYIKSFDDDKEVEEEYLDVILPKKKD